MHKNVKVFINNFKCLFKIYIDI